MGFYLHLAAALLPGNHFSTGSPNNFPTGHHRPPERSPPFTRPFLPTLPPGRPSHPNRPSRPAIQPSSHPATQPPSHPATQPSRPFPHPTTGTPYHGGRERT